MSSAPSAPSRRSRGERNRSRSTSTCTPIWGRRAQSDVLADTLDYGRLVAAAHDVVATERHQLLERVAQRIADAVLAVDRRALAVRVTVRKLRPPVPHDLDTAAVTITRTRGR